MTVAFRSEGFQSSDFSGDARNLDFYVEFQDFGTVFKKPMMTKQSMTKDDNQPPGDQSWSLPETVISLWHDRNVKYKYFEKALLFRLEINLLKCICSKDDK